MEQLAQTLQTAQRPLRNYLIEELIEALRQLKSPTAKQVTLLKKQLAQKYKAPKVPSNIEILTHLGKEEVEQLAPFLLTKPIRTASGVAPVAIMTAPSGCPHGKCIFCPGGINSPWGDVPQSYTGHEPATMRGMRNNYDSYLQVFNRLEQYTVLGQSAEKVELIVMGGTFPAMPKEYQEQFILGAFKAMNDFSELFYRDGEFDFYAFTDFFALPGEVGDKKRTQHIHEKLLQLTNERQTTLEEEQARNETVKIRCVALCIETKPDWGFLAHGNEMLRQGCTRVEVGVESVYDDVLKFTHRGHTIADTKKCFQDLRDLGFKINAHYMPGLPLTDKEKDLEGMKQLFDDPAFRPDMIKIYPTMVAPGTGLYHLWKQGKFVPLTTDEAAEMLAVFKRYVPTYCRIQRIQRDVPTKMWAAGVGTNSLRQYIHLKHKPTCRCIRCREPRGKKVDFGKLTLLVHGYDASGGKEFFISFEEPEQDLLLGFCRLRFPGQRLRQEITERTALIRELHVYGNAVPLQQEGKGNDVQHRGLGKKLMEKAEEIARENGYEKMVVIAGVGVREYYYKLGYKRDGPYVSKGW